MSRKRSRAALESHWHAVPRRRGGKRRRRGDRPAGVRQGGRLLGVRLPQVARRGVRDPRLPVGVAAPQLPGGVPVLAPERPADGLLPALHPAARRRAAGRADAAAGRQRRAWPTAASRERPRCGSASATSRASASRRGHRRRARRRRPVRRPRRPGAAGAGRQATCSPSSCGPGALRPLQRRTAGRCCGRSGCTGRRSAASWRWPWTPRRRRALPAMGELGPDGLRPRGDGPDHRPAPDGAAPPLAARQHPQLARPAHRPPRLAADGGRDDGRPPAAGHGQGHRLPAARGRARDEQHHRAAGRLRARPDRRCAPSRWSR